MLRSALFLLILSPYVLAQTGASAPPQQPAAPATQQPAAPAPSAQQPGTPEDHSHHSIQFGSPSAQAPQGQAAPAKPVPPTAPVITLNGYCEAPAAGPAPAAKPAGQVCKKVITKAEFEKIIGAVIPANRQAEFLANPQIKQQIARQYAEILVMANEARKRGIQRRPNTQELLRISQQQVLAQALVQDLNEKSTPTPVEVEQYYNENKPAFEEVILRRLMIPKPAAATPPAPPAATGSQAKPAEAASAAPTPDAAAQKAYADKARERAVAGEDFDKIQSDAFLYYKTTQAPPTTQLGPRRRGTLPPDHDAAIFGLKAGEVSQLFETANGWYLYKVESKRMLPLGEVREEISRRMQPQKFNDARSAITNSVRPDFNDDYFGAPAIPAQPGLERKPSAGPHGAGQHPTPAPKAQPPATEPK